MRVLRQLLRVLTTLLVPDNVPKAPDDPYPPKQFIGADVYAIQATAIPATIIPSDIEYGSSAHELTSAVVGFFGTEAEFHPLGPSLSAELFIPTETQIIKGIQRYSRSEHGIVGFEDAEISRLASFYREFGQEHASQFVSEGRFVAAFPSVNDILVKPFVEAIGGRPGSSDVLVGQGPGLSNPLLLTTAPEGIVLMSLAPSISSYSDRLISQLIGPRAAT
jgi:hypothetical protein